MGIQKGTTITVEFSAEQIAKLDCILQNYESFTYDSQNEPERYQRAQEDVAKIYRALHEAGYR